MTTYKSVTTSLLDWGSVAPTMKPKLRGSMAYVLAMRLEKLNRPAAERRNLPETARRNAPENSLLQELSAAELERAQ